jgi:proline dehydrogenase
MRGGVERFMPGESLEAAVAAARRLEGRGLSTVLTYLGENVEAAEEADEVREHYLRVLDEVAGNGLDAEVSIKLTQLGLDLSADRAAANLKAIAACAEERENFVWIDMESSRYVDRTLEIFRHLRQGHPNLGVCLQAYLFRTRRDLAELLTLRPAIRLVKGAYREAPNLAYQKKTKVDASYLKRASSLLQQVVGPRAGRAAFATHDLRLLAEIASRARALGIPKEAYEVQMLYGIQRQAQERLAAEGHRVRVLISYGEAWFPWFVRRLAERPANLLFLLRHLLV